MFSEEKINMRVTITKRMLKESLIQCLRNKDLNRITISELCLAAGVNRATFYKHYGTPFDLLCDIGWDYSYELQKIFNKAANGEKNGESLAQLRCCEYLYNHKDELKILFSENADRYLAKFTKEIFEEIWSHNSQMQKHLQLDPIEAKLIITGYGWSSYYMIRQWLAEDLPKTPQEIVDIINKIHGSKLSAGTFRSTSFSSGQK